MNHWTCVYCGLEHSSHNGTGSDVSCCGEVGHVEAGAEQTGEQAMTKSMHDNDCEGSNAICCCHVRRELAEAKRLLDISIASENVKYALYNDAESMRVQAEQQLAEAVNVSERRRKIIHDAVTLLPLWPTVLIKRAWDEINSAALASQSEQSEKEKE